MSTEEKTGNASYRNILKSTSIIGGATVVKILIATIRTKLVAILIGPIGIGLMGTFSEIISLVEKISNMGLEGSGVRQIAEAVGTGDEDRIARTVLTLRRICWLTGGLGMLVLIIFCVQISWITFDSGTYAISIAFLGIIILLDSIALGQGCILQGTRRISDIAKRNIIGSINGVLISVPCFYFWGQNGIVPSLILFAIASLATSWWFAHRVSINSIALQWRDSRNEAKQLLALGVNFMGASLAASLGSYIIRIALIRQFDLNGVGLFQAAFGLSGIAVGFVLNAMGTDYFPRVTSVADDNVKVRQMINEQTEVSVLIALPALSAMMIFAPLIIRAFYTESFVNAIPILRWCLFGVLGQVFSWPLGFVLLAKGKGRMYFVTELIQAAIKAIAIIVCSWIWGLNGTGIGFMFTLACYAVMMFFVMRRLTGSPWNHHTVMLILLSIALLIFFMITNTYSSIPIITWSINTVVFVPLVYICLKQLSQRSGVSVATLIAKFKSR